MIDRITLPDGTFYQFHYEPTPGFSGDVTGRLASVTLPTLGTISYTYTGGSSGHITCTDGSTPGLTRATPDGTWTYTRTAGTGAAYTTTVTDPQSDVTKIQFQGIYETQRQVNNGSSTLLQTTNTCYNVSASPCTATAIALPISQVDVYVQPAGASNLVAKHTTKYNTTYGMVAEQDDYDYSASPPGTLLQKTAITYASLGNNLVAFPQLVTVTSGGSTVSQTQYNYDETAVVATSGTPQHASVTGSRGNLTSVNSYTNASTFLTSRSTYFDTGTVQTATDVNGAQTTYTYGNCGNSFPTSVSEPISMSRSLGWNCTGGVQISSADENGQPATITYNDPYFWRPAQQNFADGGQTNWIYSGATSVTTTTKMNASQNIVTTTLLDGLGRASQTELTSDPQGTDYTLTTYDTLGRIGTVYNPTRCNPPTSNCESTWGKTIYAYDALNRVTSVTDPDSSVASASYPNNTVTVIDEAGKKRQIQTDALGRITQVTEDPGGLGYVTTYGYAALNNPTSVTSGSNQRTYAYDLLGRLTSETNPETGTSAITYVYNSNGDLSTRTDARSIVTNYNFDLLHRLISKTYSNTTQYSVYTYDISNPYSQTVSNAVGRLAAIWSGQNPQYATWTAFSYDSMGRVSTQINCFAFPWSACPNTMTTSYQHDLAGNVIQMTYPSGMVVQQSFNSAAQLCDVAGSAPSNCGSPTNAWATSFAYNPASQATGFTYGNGVSATFGYSNRLQRNSLQYVKGSNTLFSLSYAFGSAGSNNGNISYITDNVDNGRSSAYIYDSLNRLSIASTVGGSANYPQWGLSWTYDRYGNRTAQTVDRRYRAPLQTR